MASYSVSVKRSAEKELRKISSRDLLKIVQKIKTLSIHPRPDGCEMLKGDDVLYRIRQGDYRVVYEVDDEKRHVVIIKVGHRREVYK